MWLMDINRKAKTNKLLEEHVGEYLCDLGRTKVFSDRSEEAITIEDEHQ